MKQGSMTRPLTTEARRAITTDSFFKKCCRLNSECDGRITIEHAIEYAGKRIDDAWSLIPLCEFHHGLKGDGLNKRKNIRIAMSRASKQDKLKYNRLKWE